jgi:WD40 repeat protein
MRAGSSVDCLSFSEKGDILWSWSWGAQAQAWDFSTGKEWSHVAVSAECPQDAAWHPAARFLACRAEEGVELWEPGTGKKAGFLRLGESGGENIVLHRLAWSPDGRRLAGVGYLGRTLVWEVGSGALLWEIEPITDTHRSAVAWSPDGRFLAVGTSSGFIRLYEAAGGREIAQLGHGLATVRSLAFGREGRILASSSRDPDGSLRLWELPSGRELHRLGSPPGQVQDLAFSRDGATLASGDSEGSVRLWNAESHLLLQEWKPHAKSVSAILFSPLGDQLASGSWDGSVEMLSVGAARP